MNINIKSIHFDATQKLEEYINKKVEKLAKTVGNETEVDVQLKVVKPQTAMNKEAAIKLFTTSGDIYAEKVCDTFEEAVDQCLDAVGKQFSKYKEKQRNK